VVPAAFGIVLAAVYLLWAYQRVFQGDVTHEENRTMKDLQPREIAMLAPLLALIVIIGVYPKPFLDRIEPSARRVVRRLENGTVDPEVKAERAAARRRGPVIGPVELDIDGPSGSDEGDD
jgi:NADH-quinone oxidoreductase subunit M